MKNVVEHSNNLWRCTKCNGDFPECDYCYKLKIELHDHTGNLQNIIAFNDVGNELMGITEKNLFLLSIEPTDLQEICGRISGRRSLLTLSIKVDYFNGVQRLQPILINSEEIQYASACKKALTDIQAMSTSKRPIVPTFELFFRVSSNTTICT